MAPTPVVMTTRPLYLQNATNYVALDLRGALDVALDEGVGGSGELAVTQRAAGTNMSVDVAAGTASVDGDSPSGSRQYVVRSDAVTNVTVEAAPGSNSRIDLIVAQIRDAAVGGGANNDWVLTAVTGTSGATPSPPALPTSAIELAQVTVASGTSAITNAMITDRRLMMHKAAIVTALPAQVRNGQLVVDSGTGIVYRGVSGAWRSILSGVGVRSNIEGAIFGSEPATGTAMKWDTGNLSVSFLSGEGVLDLETSFTSILFAGFTALSNSSGIVVNRRTTGANTPIIANRIPLFATRVTTSDAFSGTVTINYFVFGS